MPLAVVELGPYFLFRRVGPSTGDDFATALDRLGRFLRHGPPRVVAIYDAGTDSKGSPDGRARRVCAEWIAANEALLRSKVVAFEFVANNPLSRGVLTAIFWMTRPPFTTFVHATLHGALVDASSRLAAGPSIEELAQALDRAARAAS